MKCEKCGHDSEQNKPKCGLHFCSICYTFAPNDPEELDKYIEIKVDPSSIDPYRKYSRFRGEVQKGGMIRKSSQGKHMSRVPFGYERNKNSELIPAQSRYASAASGGRRSTRIRYRARRTATGARPARPLLTSKTHSSREDSSRT